MAYIKIPLENIINIEKIVTLFSMRLECGFCFEGESHDFWELIFVLDGEIEIRCADGRRQMRRGDIFFHQPGAFHAVECRCSRGAEIFITSFECRSAAMDFFVQRKMKLGDSIHGLVDEILTEKRACFLPNVSPLEYSPGAPVGSQQMLRCYLETLLIRIMRQAESEERCERIFFTSSEELIDRLAADIVEHLRERVEENVTLDELGEKFHFSKSHICHIFKARMGCGIKKYFLGLKLERAKELLAEGKATVTEISDRLAFVSPQHFTRTFRRSTGMTPTAYRTQARGRT